MNQHEQRLDPSPAAVGPFGATDPEEQPVAIRIPVYSFNCILHTEMGERYPRLKYTLQSSLVLGVIWVISAFVFPDERNSLFRAFAVASIAMGFIHRAMVFTRVRVTHDDIDVDAHYAGFSRLHGLLGVLGIKWSESLVNRYVEPALLLCVGYASFKHVDRIFGVYAMWTGMLALLGGQIEYWKLRSRFVDRRNAKLRSRKASVELGGSTDIGQPVRATLKRPLINASEKAVVGTMQMIERLDPTLKSLIHTSGGLKLICPETEDVASAPKQPRPWKKALIFCPNPQCHRRLRVRREYVEKPRRCPVCKCHFIITKKRKEAA